MVPPLSVIWMVGAQAPGCLLVAAAGFPYVLEVSDSNFMRVALPMSVVTSFEITPSSLLPPPPGEVPSTPGVVPASPPATPAPAPTHAPPPPSGAQRLGAGGHSLVAAGAALLLTALFVFQ